jgi:hypothetical protein
MRSSNQTITMFALIVSGATQGLILAALKNQVLRRLALFSVGAACFESSKERNGPGANEDQNY